METDSTVILVPVEHPCFPDHFPGNPLVPGALLLSWLVSTVEGRLSGRRVAAVRSIKFLGPVEPGVRIEIALSSSDGFRAVQVTGEVEGTLVFKGKLELGDEA